MDFALSVSKFEKDAEKRKKLAKEKQRKEAVAKKRQDILEQARVAQALARKHEQELEKELKEQRDRAEYRLTGGVRFEVTLTAVFTDGEDDKVILPQSSLETLMSQNAFELGPMCFRIFTDKSTSEGDERYSHCGVREFTSKEGIVMIPKKVLDSLGLTDHVSDPESSATTDKNFTVTLKYVLLSKVTNVRIQPLNNLFSHVGPVKLVLEENLKYHTTLSVDDVLTIYYRGKQHKLIVKDITLQSDKEDDDKMEVEHGSIEKRNVVRGGTLVNTDLVVDIDVSEEYRQKEIEEALTSNIVSGSVTSRGRRLGKEDSSDKMLKLHYDTNVELDEEPQVGEENIITCKIKTSHGRTFTRRFRKEKPLSVLFSFVRYIFQMNQLPLPKESEMLQLSTRQPVRKFNESDVVVQCTAGSDEVPAPTFSSAGFDSKSELFYVAFV